MDSMYFLCSLNFSLFLSFSLFATKPSRNGFAFDWTCLKTNSHIRLNNVCDNAWSILSLHDINQLLCKLFNREKWISHYCNARFEVYGRHINCRNSFAIRNWNARKESILIHIYSFWKLFNFPCPKHWLTLSGITHNYARCFLLLLCRNCQPAEIDPLYRYRNGNIRFPHTEIESLTHTIQQLLSKRIGLYIPYMNKYMSTISADFLPLCSLLPMAHATFSRPTPALFLYPLFVLNPALSSILNCLHSINQSNKLNNSRRNLHTISLDAMLAPP